MQYVLPLQAVWDTHSCVGAADVGDGLVGAAVVGEEVDGEEVVGEEVVGEDVDGSAVVVAVCRARRGARRTG